VNKNCLIAVALRSITEDNLAAPALILNVVTGRSHFLLASTFPVSLPPYKNEISSDNLHHPVMHPEFDNSHPGRPDTQQSISTPPATPLPLLEKHTATNQ
jgi:hypothetical protein